MLNIALPKGRLGEKVYKLLEQIGFSSEPFASSNRKLIIENKEKDIRFFLVKPSDVAIYVEKGAADVGIVGKDILEESHADVYELLDLGIGKCTVAVAAPCKYVDDASAVLRVATTYPNIAASYFAQQSREIEIIKLHGSIEIAPIIGLCDVIVDIVETGSTLRENDLVVTDTIMDISARFIANKASAKFKSDIISQLTAKLKEIV